MRGGWKLVVGVVVVIALAIGLAFLFKPAPTPLDRAIALVKANKHAAALPLLEEIARKQPDNEEVFPWLAQCYLRTDRLAEGRTALDTALKLKLPCSLTAPVVLSFADYYEGKNDYAEAERLFASTQGSCPATDLQQGRATMYVRWADVNGNDGQTEEALKHLQAAYQLMPSNDSMKTQLPHKISEYYRELAAVAETEQKNDQRAIELLQSSLKWCDEPATRMALGSIFLRLNDTVHAIENYKAVCESDPNNLEARHHLIELYLQANNLDAAQQALLELTEKERSVENFEELTTLALKTGNHAVAVRALEEAIVLRPNDVPLLTRLHDTLVGWTEQLSKQGKTEEASSVKGHADRVADLLKQISKQDEDAQAQNTDGGSNYTPGTPPVSLVASRIWLAKGSFTPEGEIRLKNVTGKPVDDCALSMVFFDNTTRRKNGSIMVSVSGKSHPMQPNEIKSVYFSCPNIVKSDHQLAVVIFWQGRLLKELPVVKER